MSLASRARSRLSPVWPVAYNREPVGRRPSGWDRYAPNASNERREERFAYGTSLLGHDRSESDLRPGESCHFDDSSHFLDQ